MYTPNPVASSLPLIPPAWTGLPVTQAAESTSLQFHPWGQSDTKKSNKKWEESYMLLNCS